MRQIFFRGSVLVISTTNHRSNQTVNIIISIKFSKYSLNNWLSQNCDNDSFTRRTPNVNGYLTEGGAMDTES